MNIQLTQGNFGLVMRINILDLNRNAVNLINSEVTADVVFPDKTKKRYSLEIVDEANGIAELTIVEEMTAQIGTHACYIDVASTVSRVTLSEVIKYNVKADDGGVA